MAPKRAAAAAADPSSSTEEDGDASSSDSATSHEQEEADDEMEEVADDEKGEKEMEEEEPESESEEGEPEPESEEEEDWAAEGEVEEDEESTEEGDEEEDKVDFQPIRRTDPPLTAALKEEEEDVDLQPIKRIDHRPPLQPAEAEEPAAKNPPQSNKSPARDRKRASGEISKSSEPKSKRIRRVWAPEDEVLILASLAQHRRQLGGLPAWGNSDFFESIRERLEDNSCHRTDVKDKARSLLRRYKSGVVSTTDHDRRLHKLSKDVWGDLPSIGGSINGKKQADGAVFAVSGAENGGRQSDTTKDFKGMCEMYPLLAHEVKLLAEVQPGLESSFTRLDAKRALDIEKKLERIKYAELKIETQMVLEVHAPKAKIKKKLVSLLEKVSKNV